MQVDRLAFPRTVSPFVGWEIVLAGNIVEGMHGFSSLYIVLRALTVQLSDELSAIPGFFLLLPPKPLGYIGLSHRRQVLL